MSTATKQKNLTQQKFTHFYSNCLKLLADKRRYITLTPGLNTNSDLRISKRNEIAKK